MFFSQTVKKIKKKLPPSAVKKAGALQRSGQIIESIEYARLANARSLLSLDATHAEAVGAIVVVQRVDVARVEVEVARVVVASVVRRRGPIVAVGARVGQLAAIVVAQARSRETSAIAGMNGPEGGNDPTPGQTGMDN